jgi:acyl-CoA synthetase (AMP-forming)/AMP-acid ligase II
LERNAEKHPDDVALIELNPIQDDAENLQWQEYELVETGHDPHYRKELTWKEFDDLANRFANLLIDKGVKKGDKVAILLMNCIDWLPIYFGALKTGAVAVPLNFRYTSDEISYCVNLSDAEILVFGREFTERVNSVRSELTNINEFIFLGMEKPDYAESFEGMIADYPAIKPDVTMSEDDDAAIYYSS